LPAEFHLDISEELLTEVQEEIVRNIETAVQSASTRDELLLQYNAQIDGLLGQQSGPTRWQNAATVDDPLTLKALLFTDAQGTAIFHKSPLCLVDAVDPADKESAEIQEDFLASKGAEINLGDRLADAYYNAARYPAAFIRVGWKETQRVMRSVQYRDLETGEIVEHPEEGRVAYEKVLVGTKEVDYRGPDVEVVDTGNIYHYPFASKDPQSAVGFGERIYLTKQDLLVGIEDYGYDRDSVMTLLAHHPTDTRMSQQQEHVDIQWGTGEQSESEFYEFFLWYTKMPVLQDVDGSLKLPEYLWNTELECVCSKSEPKIFLRIDFSPYSRRPYVKFHTGKEPGSMYTRCLASELDSLQCQGNANIRAVIDGLNIEMSPTFKALESSLKDNEDFEFGPGSVYKCKTSLEEMEPMRMESNARLGLELQGILDARAEGLYSGGFGQLQGKVRKNEEMKQVQATAASLQDCMISNFLRGANELFAWLITLCQDKMGDDEPIAFADDQGRGKKLTMSTLKGNYIYRAMGSTSSANSEARINKAQMALQIATGYLETKGKVADPKDLEHLWYASRQVLIDIDVHDPEDYIGERPEVSGQAQASPVPSPMSMNGASSGNGRGNTGSVVGAAKG
jgi:hypothetical protein